VRKWFTLENLPSVDILVINIFQERIRWA